MTVVAPVRSAARRTAIHTGLLAASVAAMVWGALAFGAVYRWAYTPLAITCGAVGLLALIVERAGRPRFGGLAIAFAALLTAIALQLVPLDIDVLRRVSPATDAFLSQYDFGYELARSGDVGGAATEPSTAPLKHAVSIAPGKTLIGAGLLASLTLFLFGATRLVSVVSARTTSRCVIAFGGILAIVGIAQRGLTATDLHPKIYGFWQPQFESTPFGPFVNPNHFAGWMVMALPLTVAALIDAIVQAIESDPPERGRPFAFLSGPHGGASVMLGFTAILMALSLVMTKSRSALAAFAVGMLLSGWTVWRRQSSGAARAGIVAAVIVLLAGTIGWAGLDTLMSKFTDGQSSKSFAMRREAWSDTVEIIRRFPIAGSGFNTYGTAMMVYQSRNKGLHFQEAHNEYLQLAAEGGVLLAVPILAAIGLFVRDVRRRFREAPKVGSTYTLRVGAAVGLVCIAMQSLLEFSLQMPGNAVLFALLAAIALHQSPNLRRTPPVQR